MFKLFRSAPTQVQGYNNGLLVGCGAEDNPSYKECYALAREISNHGVEVMVTDEYWPRDSIVLSKDGQLFNEDSDTIWFHFHKSRYFEGGLFLTTPKGILASDELMDYRRKDTSTGLRGIVSKALSLEDLHQNTCDQLGTQEIHLFPIQFLYQGITPCRVDPFTSAVPKDTGHIDYGFNVLNKAGVVVTYDHPLFASTADQMAEITGYDIRTLPLEESSFFAVGFIELGDHVVFEKRSKALPGMLNELGYHPIPSPKPMKGTNKGHGSIRCRTQEIPICLERVILTDKKSDISIQLMTLDGQYISIPKNLRLWDSQQQLGL